MNALRPPLISVVDPCRRQLPQYTHARRAPLFFSVEERFKRKQIVYLCFHVNIAGLLFQFCGLFAQGSTVALCLSNVA
jgi:hypothetical protein